MKDRPTLGSPLPLRLLGVGLIFAWDWCLTSTSTTSLSDTDNGTLNAFNLLMIIIQVCTLIVLALLSRRIGALSRRPVIPLLGCIASVAGAALLVVCANDLVPYGIWARVAAVLVGFGVAVLILSWAEVYSRLGQGRVFLYGALSILLAAVVYLLICQCSPAVRLAATIAIPFISYGLWYLSILYTGPEEVAGRERVRFSFPWKPVVIMAVCGFAAAFIDVALFSQGTQPHVWADFAIGALVLVGIALVRGYARPVFLVGVAMGCMLAGVIIVAFLGSSAAWTASFLTMASYVAMTLFTCALLSNICYRYGVSSLWLFGFAWAARTIADRIGGFLPSFIPGFSEMADSSFDLALMAVVGLVMVVVVLVLWLSERSFNSTWAVETIDLELGRHVPNEREQRLAACAALSKRCALTERETEVLEMLVDGCSYQELCQGLMLSLNTVKTHVRHVYAKLDVHTREEAVALVDAEAHA